MGSDKMSLWKRGFLEIIADILDSLIGSPLKKTHITFRCNLDSRAVTKYLSIIIHIGLVERSKEDPSFYTITQKGIKYRNKFQSFITVMEKDLEQFHIQIDNKKEILTNLQMKSF